MIPPWTVPPNFLAYAQAGAETGLGAGRLAQAGREASARIALAGQELAAQNERAKEANALRQQDLMASLLERSQASQMMKQFHDAEVAERMRHNLATEAVPKSGFKSFELGKNSKVGHYDPATGKFIVDFSNELLPKPGELDDTAKKALMQNLKHHQTVFQRAISGLSKPNLGDDERNILKQQLSDASNNIDLINAKLNPSSAPVADNSAPPVTADQAFGFDPALRNFGNEGGLFPKVDPSVLNPVTNPSGTILPTAPQLIWDHTTGKLQPLGQ